MKKFLLVFMALMFLTATAQAANPVRIARLPIIFKSTIPDYDTRTELEMKITRAAHIPLNKTLQVAEYLPTKESTQALDNIWQQMRSGDKHARIQDAMKPLAEKLNADLIICPILLNYEQYADTLTISGETYLHSYAKAELIIYDRRTDNLIDKKTSRIYQDVTSKIGTADYLAKICFDKVIDDTKLRQIILSIR